MTSYLKTFDEGTDTVAIPVTGDVIAVTGAPTFTAETMHGPLAARFIGTTAIARLQLPFTGSHKGSFYFKIDFAPTASAVRILRITTATNTVCADIRVHGTNGHFDIANTTGSVAATGTFNWVAGNWYRCDYMWTETLGGNSTISVRFFQNEESEIQSDAFSATYPSQSATAARLMIGSQAGSGGGSTILIDTIRADTDMTDWYTAYASSALPPGTVTHQWGGNSTATSFTVKARVNAGTTCRLKYATNQSLTGGLFVSNQVPDSNGYVTFNVTGLNPDTTYYW